MLTPLTPSPTHPLTPRPASAAAILRRVLAAHFAPREKMTVDRWADTRRVMTEDSSNNPGAWRTSTVPYTRFPMRLMTEPAVLELLFCWASQTAKTETMINYIGWLSECDPAPCMVVLPNAEDAQDFNKDRVQTAIRASPTWYSQLHGPLGKKDRSLRAKQTHFTRCKVYYRGSNSQAKVRSKPAKHRVVDELDSDEFEYGAVEDIRQRAAAWPGGKLLMGSIPSFLGQGIELELSRALEFRYHVPCPRCLKYLELRLTGLKWDGPASRANAQHARDTAHFVCDHCKSRIDEHHKPWMLVRGCWVPQGASVVREEPGDRGGFDLKAAQRWRPTPGEEGMELMPGCRIVGGPVSLPARVGLRLPAFYSPWVRWGDIARSFCEMNGQPTPGWRNGVLAEGYAPVANKVDADQVIRRFLKVETSSEQARAASRAAGAYRLGECPPGVLAITASIDLQRTHAYIVFRGWGRRCEESWLLWFTAIKAPHGDLAMTSQNIFRAVSRTFAREGKAPLAAWRWTIDSGDGVRTADVYSICRASGGRGIACKGLTGAMTQPAHEVLIDKWPDGSPMPGGVMLLEVNTWHYKGMILSRLTGPAEDEQEHDGGSGGNGDGLEDRAAPRASARELVTMHRWHWPDPDVDVFGNPIRGRVVQYLEQLTSEELILANAKAVEKGQAAKWAWRRKAGRKANHFLDAEVYGTALAELKMPLLGVQGAPGSGTAAPRTRLRFSGLREDDGED